MTDPVNDYVVMRIRRLRVARGIRVKDMAERSGIPLGSYSCLETGRYRVKLENLFRIVNVLGVDIGEVWPKWSDKPRTVKQAHDKFIRSALHEASSRTPAEISLADVVDAVCEVFNVTRDELESPSRERRLAEARTVATVLTREQNHLTMVSLSRALRRDVSSLAHCLRRLEARLRWDRRLQGMIEEARCRLKEIHFDRETP